MQFPLLREVATPIKRVSFQEIDEEASKIKLYTISGLTGKWKIDEGFQLFGNESLDGVFQQLIATEVKYLFAQTQCPHRIYQTDDEMFVVLTQVSELEESSPSQKQAVSKLNQWLLGFDQTEYSDPSVYWQREIELSMNDLYEFDSENWPELAELYSMKEPSLDNVDAQLELTQLLFLLLILPVNIRTKYLANLNDEAIWQATVLSEPNAFQEYVTKCSQKEHEAIITKLLSKTQLLKADFENSTHRFKKDMLDGIERLIFECEAVSVIQKINASLLADYQPDIETMAKSMLEQLRNAVNIPCDEVLFKLKSFWHGLEQFENQLTEIHHMTENMHWEGRFYYKKALTACFKDDGYVGALYKATFKEIHPSYLASGTMLMFHQNELQQKLDKIQVPLQKAYDEATLADRIKKGLKILNVQVPSLADFFYGLWLPKNLSNTSLTNKRAAYKILHILTTLCEATSISQSNVINATTNTDVCDIYKVDDVLKEISSEYIEQLSCQVIVRRLIAALCQGQDINDAINHFKKSYREHSVGFQIQRNRDLIAAQCAEIINLYKHDKLSDAQSMLVTWVKYINKYIATSNEVGQQIREILNQLLDSKSTSLPEASDKIVKDKILEIARVFLYGQEQRCKQDYSHSTELPIEQKNVVRVQMQAVNLCSQLHTLLMNLDLKFSYFSDYELLGQLVFGLDSINLSEHTDQLFKKINTRLEQLNNIIELKNLITKLEEENIYTKLTELQRHYLTVSKSLLHQEPIIFRNIVTCKLKLSEIFASLNSVSLARSDIDSSIGSQSPRSPHSPSLYLRKPFYHSLTIGSPTMFKDISQQNGSKTVGELSMQLSHDTHQQQVSVF